MAGRRQDSRGWRIHSCVFYFRDGVTHEHSANQSYLHHRTPRGFVRERKSIRPN
jgi:hypothetical protein